ncbi:MAG: glycosyltransferase family 4 protein [Verrucomicrobiota bacterium]
MSGVGNASGKLRVAVTMEPESWILRQVAEHFRQLASERLKVLPLDLGQPVPQAADAVLYVNWPHLLDCAPGRRDMPGLLMVQHMDRTAFRLRYLLWKHPRMQVVCMARNWVERMQRYFIPADRLHLIPFGVDLEQFLPAEQAPDGGRIRIGFVGRAYPDGRKGEDRLLAISRQLSPERFEFVLVGDRWEALGAALKSRGFPTAYHRYLEGAAVPGVMATTDVLLVCSRNEGGPQPVLEALACGVPVVSTKVGFVTDLQKRLPQYVSLFDSDAVVPEILADARRKRAMAQANTALIHQELQSFTWESWASRTERLLVRAAAGQAAVATNID